MLWLIRLHPLEKTGFKLFGIKACQNLHYQSHERVFRWANRAGLETRRLALPSQTLRFRPSFGSTDCPTNGHDDDISSTVAFGLLHPMDLLLSQRTSLGLSVCFFLNLFLSLFGTSSLTFLNEDTITLLLPGNPSQSARKSAIIEEKG